MRDQEPPALLRRAVAVLAELLAYWAANQPAAAQQECLVTWRGSDAEPLPEA